MAAQDDAAFEAQKQVLARRLDRFEAPPVEPRRELLDRCARMRSLDLDPLADEQLQPLGRTSERVAFGHSCQASAVQAPRKLRSASAGAAAATVWGLLEPLDQRLFRCDYSDIALLGKAVTRGPRWRSVGYALHALNGAIFGVVFDRVRGKIPIAPRRLALGMTLAEHLTLYPLCYFVDRYHPARGEEGLPPLLTNRRAFAQATARHLVFGLIVGRLVRGEERPDEDPPGSRPRRAAASPRSR
jgi:hypothetical protein